MRTATAGHPFQTIKPMPIEKIGLALFTPLMAPTPVATTLPQPDRDADTVDGFLRLEAAGGHQMADDVMYLSHLLLHAYDPDEKDAEEIICTAVAYGANASGQGILDPDTGWEWWITYSRVSGLPIRHKDPAVNLTRYRAMVVWQYIGKPI